MTMCDECIKRDVCRKKYTVGPICVSYINENRLLNTSCVPGKTIFFRVGETIKECIVTMVIIDTKTTIYCKEKSNQNEWAFLHTCIGKTVFHTEEALKKKEEHNSLLNHEKSEKNTPERV